MSLPGGYKDVRHLLWRLSFSRAEKHLTKYAGRTPPETSVAGTAANKAVPTCKKTVLRTLKRILEILKGFDNSREKKPNPKMVELQKAADKLRNLEESPFSIEKFTTFQVGASVLMTQNLGPWQSLPHSRWVQV